ncbi:MAG: hypothetical protein ACE5HI_18480, partial [bacterium]
HLGGSEILKVRFPSIEKEIYEIVSQIDVKKTKISKELRRTRCFLEIESRRKGTNRETKPSWRYRASLPLGNESLYLLNTRRRGNIQGIG